MKESEFNVIEENDVNGITIYNTQSGGVLDLDAAHTNEPVSYTHLTLPTICSV